MKNIFVANLSLLGYLGSWSYLIKKKIIGMKDLIVLSLEGMSSVSRVQVFCLQAESSYILYIIHHLYIKRGKYRPTSLRIIRMI